MLPHVLAAMRGREPDAVGRLAEALGVPVDGLPERVTALGGGRRTLTDLGVRPEQLEAIAEAALERPELRSMTPPPDREELLSLLRRAFRS
jgi:alcohol dehydrogenase class IV